MSRIVPFIVVLLVVTGCSQRNYDVADPVVGPVPPRIQRDGAVAEAERSPSGVQQVSYEQGPMPRTAVVARVNGTPVLAGEVIDFAAANNEKLGGALAVAREKASPEEFRKIQETIIKNFLPQLTEQAMMVDAVKSKLSKEQLEAVQLQLDEFFASEVEQMKKQFEVESTAELEGILQSRGMSLETMQGMFSQRQLGTEFVRGKMGEDAPVTRAELLSEYQSRLEEYAFPAQIKWQQLQVSVPASGGEREAVSKMDQIISELKNGADFSDVVKRYSDGPLAKNGGHWDWTQPDSIASKDVREALKTLQKNQISQPIRVGDHLQLILVNGRKEAGHTPFEEVQEYLRKEMVERRRMKMAETILTELKETAIVETMFDEDFDGIRATIQ